MTSKLVNIQLLRKVYFNNEYHQCTKICNGAKNDSPV